MFLVNELLKKALEYFARRIESGRAQHDGAIKSIRIAMRALCIAERGLASDWNRIAQITSPRSRSRCVFDGT